MMWLECESWAAGHFIREMWTALPAELLRSSALTPSPWVMLGPGRAGGKWDLIVMMMMCLFSHLHIGALWESSARLDTPVFGVHLHLSSRVGNVRSFCA